MLRHKNINYKNVIIGLLLILAGGLLFTVHYNNSQKQFHEIANQNDTQTADPAADYSDAQVSNPAANYCIGLGYQYKTKKDNGEVGVCVLPENIECDAWKFFNGRCGQRYTFCEKSGGKITITNKNCQFSPECAVCILQNGVECNEWKYFKGKCP